MLCPPIDIADQLRAAVRATRAVIGMRLANRPGWDDFLNAVVVGQQHVASRVVVRGDRDQPHGAGEELVDRITLAEARAAGRYLDAAAQRPIAREIPDVELAVLRVGGDETVTGA